MDEIVLGEAHMVPVQFVRWLGRAATGDLRRSTISQRRMGEVLVSPAIVTFQLGMFAWLIGTLIAIPAGVISAVYRGRMPVFVATMVAVEAAGTSRIKVMSRHILPNAIAPVIMQATLGMGYAVPAEAALAFNLLGDALRDILDPRLRGVVR